MKKLMIVTLLYLLVCAVFAGTAFAQSAAPAVTDVLAAYNDAVEAYSWFDLSSMRCTEGNTDTIMWDDDGKLDDPVRYDRVDVPGIGSMAELEAYLRSLFTDEIVDELLAMNDDYQQYKDFDGKLYAIQGARGADIFVGEEAYEVIFVDDKTFDVMVLAEDLDEDQKLIGHTVHDFFYEDIDGNGTWRFSNFNLTR